MAVSASPAWDRELQVRPLKRREYDRLVDEGVFDDERIELLEGTLIEMSPEGTEHAWIIQELNRLLTRGLPDELRLRVAAPFAANNVSEPEPDCAVVPVGDYWVDHPSVALLLIEVSRSSRRKDLGLKARIYGAAGVPSYWVVDLERRVVHVHQEPTGDGYGRVEQHPFTATLDAVGVEVSFGHLLPPPKA